MFSSNPKVLRDERSWKTWKRIQKIVMDEESIREELCDGCQN